jgi:Tfp pilus assembly protein PilN
MARGASVSPQSDGHGDVFADHLGAMIVHVQRENGVAHRTFVLRPWHVRLLRAGVRRSTRILAAVVVLSWGYLAIQALRVPLLTRRIAHMEEESARLDTLQQTLKDLQARYDQVQSMLSRPATGTAAKSGTGARAP